MRRLVLRPCARSPLQHDFAEHHGTACVHPARPHQVKAYVAHDEDDEAEAAIYSQSDRGKNAVKKDASELRGNPTFVEMVAYLRKELNLSKRATKADVIEMAWRELELDDANASGLTLRTKAEKCFHIVSAPEPLPDSEEVKPKSMPTPANQIKTPDVQTNGTSNTMVFVPSPVNKMNDDSTPSATQGRDTPEIPKSQRTSFRPQFSLRAAPSDRKHNVLSAQSSPKSDGTATQMM